MLKAFTAAVLICVMRLDSRAALSIVLDAWSVNCIGLRSFGLIVGVSRVLCSSAVPGVWSLLRVKRSNVSMRFYDDLELLGAGGARPL